MTETRSTLERELDRLSPPRIPFDQLERRRDRKRRDQRIRAGALGIAVLIAMGWLGINAIRSAPVPADDPTPTPVPSEDLGIFQPVAGRIVYGNMRPRSGGIFAVDPRRPNDPNDRILLSERSGEPLGWSSDGSRLLIRREVPDSKRDPVNDLDLFVLNADGTETRVTQDRDWITGSISPDGSQVVYAPGYDGRMYTVDTGGGEPRLLRDSADLVYNPTFSPDGTQIAYVDGGGDHTHNVWVMNADGSDPHEIVSNEWTDPAGHVEGLAWSPTGDRIALALIDGPSPAIYMFAPDGSDFTQVIPGGARPYWSPNGSQIAYVVPGRLGLFIADADGSNVRKSGFAASGPWHPGPIASTEPSPVPIDDPTTTPAPSEFRRGAEFIVFEPSGIGLGWDLAAQDPETGEVRKIAETDGIVDCPDTQGCRNFVESPEWSPDGRWLAFEVSNDSLNTGPLGPCTPTVGVWVTNALGELRQLTTPCETPPSGSNGVVEEMWEWSPDGTRIAYAQTDGGTDELLLIDPSDGSRTSLGTADLPTDWGSPGWALQWSPDGTRIAYVDGGSVSVVDVDGGERSLLADSFVDIVEIAWSPDGTHMLVHDQGRYRIQVMDADGSDLHVVLEGEDACCETDWSPDGDRILYMLSVGPMFNFDTEIWTVSPDGSDPIKVFDSNGCDSGNTPDGLPAWSPDGAQVAYIACTVWVVANADGTGEAQPIDKLVWRSWRSGGLTELELRKIGQWLH
jgi:Tol biopolymer transport system component